MPQFIAFLRAINVGGRSIRMAALAEHFRAIGFTNVRTFINSGNVIFDAAGVTAAAAIETMIETKLEPRLGFRTEAFLRSPEELRRATTRAGALLGSAPEIQVVNVAFLKAPLDAAGKRAVAGFTSDIDQFEIREREVYWMCRTKQSDSKFSNALFERKLGVRSTFRAQTMLVRLLGQL